MALVLAIVGASEMARNEGGRGACELAGGRAKSSTLVALAEVADSEIGDALDGAAGSGETMSPGGELILGFGGMRGKYREGSNSAGYWAKSIDREPRIDLNRPQVCLEPLVDRWRAEAVVDYGIFM